jgi:hypothetical protein
MKFTDERVKKQIDRGDRRRQCGRGGAAETDSR